MKKYALGFALVAVGAVTQAIPASADKLDDVLARLEAIEKNNAKLANENFVAKAAPVAVQRERDRQLQLREQREKIQALLRALQ